jgi:N-dimethylarginine dimethylaminohydrolase
MTTTMPMSTEVRRSARQQHYLMCRPDFFSVTYAINPWMDPAVPVDEVRALAQWDTLRRTYESLGHQVDLIAAAADLPDMVFAANGGIVVDGRALAAHFTYAERQAEGGLYCDWFAKSGFSDARQAEHQNEGEGDFLKVGEIILAGTCTSRGCCVLRPYRRFADPGRPEVLPPRHRARGARRDHGGLLPRCL